MGFGPVEARCGTLYFNLKPVFYWFLLLHQHFLTQTAWKKQCGWYYSLAFPSLGLTNSQVGSASVILTHYRCVGVSKSKANTINYYTELLHPWVRDIMGNTGLPCQDLCSCPQAAIIVGPWASYVALLNLSPENRVKMRECVCRVLVPG